MNNLEKIQNILPLGYLYLVVLGILKESVVFYQLGINILKYSTITDVLMSPIAVITSHPLIFLVFVLASLYPVLMRYIFLKHSDKKWARPIFGISKNKNEMNEEEKEAFGNSLLIKIGLMFYLSIFLGIAFQEGRMLSKNIKNNKLKYEYQLTYNTDNSELVSLINTNNEYYFYVVKGTKEITIAPTSSIKFIKLVDNKMLK